VVSYPEPRRYGGGPTSFERMAGRSFVYDNALYVLLRSFEGQEVAARQVLQTIAALQRPDGAWGFSFNIRGDGFYNVDYVRTGAVAWVPGQASSSRNGGSTASVTVTGGSPSMTA